MGRRRLKNGRWRYTGPTKGNVFNLVIGAEGERIWETCYLGIALTTRKMTEKMDHGGCLFFDYRGRRMNECVL